MRVVRTTAARLGTAFGLARAARPGVLLAHLGTSAVAGAAPVATVWWAKVAVDRVAAGAGSGALWAAGAGLAAAGLLAAAAPPVSRYLQSELERGVTAEAKDRLYRAVTDIPLLGALERPAFRDRLRLAEQASRSGPGQVVDSALGLVQSTTTLVGMVGALAVVAPAVAALLVVAALPALAAEILLSRRRAEMAWRISPAERRELFYTDLLTDLRAAKEVRLFGLRGLFRHRMLQELATSNREQRRFDRREAVTQLLLAALSAVLAGGCIVWALLAAARGALTLGDVAAVLLAVGSVQATLTAAVNHVSLGHHAALLLDHYRAVVGATATGRGPAPGTAPDPADRSPAVPVSGADHAAAPGSGGPADHVPAAVARGNGSSGNGSARGIEFDDVWFRYADDLPWALRGVSLSIPTGRALAVVGENGSGKSTLVKLLCRFYDPVRGGVRWDGTDLRDIPLDELHGRIAAVFQDFMDYELTAGENIALGDAAGRTELDVDADRVAGAARRAQVHEALAALPQGYRTLLSREFSAAGEDGPPGVLLSGGQWQRVALARALLRGDRSLLVLDEPSSGLDAEAEFRIHQEMRRYREGRTSVLVSHRLNTVRDADRIVVLAAGRVAEEGDHDALVAAGGQYARLFELQAAGYETSPA